MKVEASSRPFDELARLIARRAISAAELVEACLDRISELEGRVHAWAFVDADGARAQAEARDAEPPRGPLHGIPVGIKDIIDTAGIPTEMGSPIHRGRRPTSDARPVARLRAAGAIVLGKTVTTEFATWTPAATRNPHDPKRTPGGSSSGSAAAVAAGMVPLALGTQTVGSTIRPAAFCGIAALKPTHGTTSLDGVLLHSTKLDTLGFMAADVSGLVALARVLCDGIDTAVDEARRRVAVARTPWWERAEPASRQALERAADALREHGATVDERDLPVECAVLPAAHQLVTEHDVARGLAQHASDPRLSVQLRELVERGLRIATADRETALAHGRDADRELTRLWADYDALLVPAITGEAPRLADGTGDAIFCQPWSLLGTPAATIPAATGPHGLPIGVQLVAPRGRDLALLQIAELAQPRPSPAISRGSSGVASAPSD